MAERNMLQNNGTPNLARSADKAEVGAMSTNTMPSYAHWADVKGHVQYNMISGGHQLIGTRGQFGQITRVTTRQQQLPTRKSDINLLGSDTVNVELRFRRG
eukprot:3659840-Amphidinium_carterae.1